MIDCTKNQTVTLWKVTPKDSPELLEIYKPYVTDTAISFEYNVPSQKEFMERVSNTVKNYPYIAAPALSIQASAAAFTRPLNNACASKIYSMPMPVLPGRVMKTTI